MQRTTDAPLYNSTIIKNYVEYLKANYPDVNLTEMLHYAGIDEYEVEDRGHWLTQTQINRFHEYMDRVINNPGLCREAGRFIASHKSSAYSILQQSMSGFLSPAMAYWAVEKVAANIARHQNVKGRSLAKNKFEILVTTSPEVKEERFQCDFRLGTYEAISEIFTGKYATVEHPECRHEGAPHCRYIITWESPKSLIWTKIGSYGLAASVLTSFPLLYFLPLEHWLIFILSSFLFCIGILFFGSVSRNREIAANLILQEKTSVEVLNNINLRYNETLLVREISEAAATLTNPRDFIGFITDALHQKLNFTRSLVMLTHPEKTKFVYSAGHGFTPHEEALLNKRSISLPLPDPHGYLSDIHARWKSSPVEAQQLNTGPFSGMINDLMRELGVTSFIAIPILHKKSIEGILAVDASKYHPKPTHSDINLLAGIAQQIGTYLGYAQWQKIAGENEKRFHHLSENAPDIVYQLDLDGRIKYVNPAWKDLFGHQSTDLNEKYLMDFLKEEDRLSFEHTFQNVVNNKSKAQGMLFTLFNARGLPRQILLSGSPDMNADGNVNGMIGIIKDISKLRSMEAQLVQASKREVTNTLTGGILQDFNNIIRAVIGYNRLSLAGGFDEEPDILYRNSLDEFISHSRELVRQLLIFNKKLPPLARKINLNEEIVNARQMISKSLPRMIDIKTDLSPDLSPVIADPAQIGQVLFNLVMNAVDAMQANGVIRIKTDNWIVRENTAVGGFEIPAGAYARISITDTGCGMEESLVKRIYEPFFTTKETVKGAGLGLSVAYSIVKNHKGFIFCESKPNQGTTFHLIFPASMPEKSVSL